MMLNVLSTWLYDGDPEPIAFEKPLNAIKGKVKPERDISECYAEQLLNTRIVHSRVPTRLGSS